MSAWVWLVIAAVLLGLEVAVQADFWLAVLGSAALAVGLVTAIGLEAPLSLQLVSFGALSIALTLFVRRRLHEKLVGRAPGIRDDLVRESVTVADAIEPGETGSVQHRGSPWQARNVGAVTIPAGSEARIQRVSGLTLELRALSPTKSTA